MECESRPPALLEDEVGQEEEDAESGGWDEWEADNCEEEEEEEYVCLFCPSRLASTPLLFQHCSSQHGFDFLQLRKDLNLGFYDCLRLINFIRSQVAHNTCWICGLGMDNKDAMLEHIKETNHVEFIKQGSSVDSKESCSDPDQEHDRSFVHPWQDDKYLTPALENDSLLYSFEENSDDDVNEEQVLPQGTHILDNNELKDLLFENDLGVFALDGTDSHPSNGRENGLSQQKETKFNPVITENRNITTETCPAVPKRGNKLKVSFAEVAARERYSINESYFGSYSTFGIHREMLSDKVRTDAYETAILRNPALFKGAVVLDLGCGTGILSLFAAKAGAQEVIAVEGSKRMSAVARQVAKSNGFLNASDTPASREKGAVINVVQGMVEEVDLQNLLEVSGADILVSEWMGYCLLFESMLSSVLFARDRWLKPGGAILPDIAEMYVAGFGVGGTSLRFWENVYGFDMECIGREVLEDASSSLIVDVVESKDVVTDSCLLQTFDLVTMTDSEVDFTAPFELHPLSSLATEAGSNHIACYGLVVWFDIHFSSRFCQEYPAVLSTSPFTPKTHWSQTLLTFKEPVFLAVSTIPKQHMIRSGKVGTSTSPALSLNGRISIARSSRHRSIDISLEMAAVGHLGATQEWPIQMFDM